MKGFTLIELITIIIILGIISVITVPIVSDLSDKAEASANKSSVSNYASSLRLTYTDDYITDGDTLRRKTNEKMQGKEVICQTIGFHSTYGPILDNCTVDDSEQVYYYLDKTETTRPSNMDEIINSATIIDSID